MRRLNLFAKGNMDVHGSLLFSAVAGKVEWNGLNELLCEEFPEHVARVRHETWTRSDALLEAGGSPPPEVLGRQLPLGAFSARSQFSTRVFESPGEAVVLSLQPDVFNMPLRHRKEGYLLLANNWQEWSEADRQWARDEFEPQGLLGPEQSMAFLERICARIRAGGCQHVLIYNLSSIMLGERVHCYCGLGESLSVRIRRFNLALVELSSRLGVSVVDVDSVVARAGAERLRVGPFQLTAEGYRLVALEVMHILLDLGCFD